MIASNEIFENYTALILITYAIFDCLIFFI